MGLCVVVPVVGTCVVFVGVDCVVTSVVETSAIFCCVLTRVETFETLLQYLLFVAGASAASAVCVNNSRNI